MSDQAPDAGEEKYKSPTISRKQKSRISWIWLVPIVAALMGMSLVIRTWMQAGPDISISFNTAEGLEVGKTQLRYKDVNIGTVKSIGFNDDPVGFLNAGGFWTPLLEVLNGLVDAGFVRREVLDDVVVADDLAAALASLAAR